MPDASPRPTWTTIIAVMVGGGVITGLLLGGLGGSLGLTGGAATAGVGAAIGAVGGLLIARRRAPKGPDSGDARK